MAGTITHQWNGTILTISSDSGTSAMDLKGAKGDDGPRGPQGIPGDANLIDAVAAAEKAAADAETALSQLGTARDEAVVAAAQVKAIVAGNEAYTKAESDSRFANAIKPTVKDNIVSITDAAAAPTVEAISHIEPLQSGTGVASPTNIRPISGWNAATMRRTNKNFMTDFGFDNTYTVSGITWTNNHDGTIIVNGTATAYAYSNGLGGCVLGVLPAGRYAASFYPAEVANIVGIRIGVETADNTAAYVIMSADGKNTAYFDADGVSVYKMSLYIHTGATVNNIVLKPQIEKEIYTEYEKPLAQTLTATLPQTIYGGELDWNTGVLTNKYIRLVFDGVSEGKKFNSSDSNTGETAYISKRYLPAEGKPAGKTYSNISNSVRIATAGPIIVGLPASLTGTTATDDAATITAKFNAACASLNAAGTPLEIVYELATPTTYQLTPQQLETLKGVNNVWSDCGETTLTYVADTKLYIDNKIATLTNALVSLGGNI